MRTYSFIYERCVIAEAPGVPDSFGYGCLRCGRRYTIRYSLDRHLKWECGVEKQFLCQTCFRRFSRIDNLRSHQKASGHDLTPYSRRRFSWSTFSIYLSDLLSSDNFSATVRFLVIYYSNYLGKFVNFVKKKNKKILER